MTDGDVGRVDDETAGDDEAVGRADLAGVQSDDDAGNRRRGATAGAVLEFITKSLTDSPDEVAIEADDRGGSIRFRVRAAQGDMGRLIGRRGRVAQAVRTVVRVAGAQDGVDTHVDFVDD